MGVKFDRMKDGYNRYQVDALIEELNMHISSLERSNEAYRNRCAQLEEQVCAPFAADYLAGRTPLPCARCNPTVKFPALFRRAEEVGAQFVATGHYARIRQTEYGPALCRGVHTNDQAYMLARLPRQWSSLQTLFL